MNTLVGMRIKTRMPSEELEKLLEKCCQKKASLNFDGIEEKSGVQYKVVIIAFADEQDRDAFRALLSKK